MPTPATHTVTRPATETASCARCGSRLRLSGAGRWITPGLGRLPQGTSAEWCPGTVAPHDAPPVETVTGPARRA